MTGHVDLYRLSAIGIDDKPYPFLRRMEADGLARSSIKGALPYWNGYVWYTSVHDDGECESHRP